MKLRNFVITAVVVGLSGPAFAQTGSGQQTAANAPAGQAAVVTTPSDNPRGWMASGFIGTNFGSSRSSSVDLSGIENLDTNNSTSVNCGGQVGYFARGMIGGEFLADFSPGLGTFNNVLFERSPNVNSYMFNLIAAAPFGHVHSFDPYISGGIGCGDDGRRHLHGRPDRIPNVSADRNGERQRVEIRMGHRRRSHGVV